MSGHFSHSVFPLINAEMMQQLYINNCVFTFASEFRQNNAHALRFWCVKCTDPKGEYIGQASKLKHKCVILSKFSSTK